MYEIYADETLIYDSTLEDYKIAKGTITREADKSGSFVFSLYPDHFFYNSFVKLRTVIRVHKSGRIVFRGRVLDDKADYWNNKELTCEGELGFLQDSIIRPYTFSGTPEQLFRQLIEAHNAQVDEFKRFKIGTCTVVDPNGYIARSNTAYESALSNLTSRLLEDATGGHLYVTHGDDGTDPVPTIHYLADFTKVATQAIEFGVNLKDYAKTEDAKDIATAIIPLGKETNGVKLTISKVNGGVDYVYSAAGVALRGWIFKTMEWQDVTEAANLKAKAEAAVEAAVNQAVTIELTAVDLHLLDHSIESFNCCEYVPVRSTPHNFEATLLCNKQTMDLLKPDNDTVVLGHAYSTFTASSSKAAASVTNVKALQSSVAQVTQQVVDLNKTVAGVTGASVTVTASDLLELDAATMTEAQTWATQFGASVELRPVGLVYDALYAAMQQGAQGRVRLAEELAGYPVEIVTGYALTSVGLMAQTMSAVWVFPNGSYHGEDTDPYN